MTTEANSQDSTNQQSESIVLEDSTAKSEPLVVAALKPSGHDADGLNTDDRKIGEWKSRYPTEAIAEIRKDAWFVAVVLGLTLVSLILVWNGTMHKWVAWTCASTCAPETLTKYSLFFLGGLLGGVLFGIKYLYKVVGRGMWNMDRRLWRVFSPFVSGGLALAIGAMVDSGIMGLTINTTSASGFFSMGFITGYFADGALAKMQDVADTIFGSPRKNFSSSGDKTNG